MGVISNPHVANIYIEQREYANDAQRHIKNSYLNKMTAALRRKNMWADRQTYFQLVVQPILGENIAPILNHLTLSYDELKNKVAQAYDRAGYAPVVCFTVSIISGIFAKSLWNKNPSINSVKFIIAVASSVFWFLASMAQGKNLTYVGDLQRKLAKVERSVDAVKVTISGEVLNSLKQRGKLTEMFPEVPGLIPHYIKTGLKDKVCMIFADVLTDSYPIRL